MVVFLVTFAGNGVKTHLENDGEISLGLIHVHPSNPSNRRQKTVSMPMSLK